MTETQAQRESTSNRRVTLELDEAEVRVLMEAIGIQLRAPADTGRSFLFGIRQRLLAATIPFQDAAQDKTPP